MLKYAQVANVRRTLSKIVSGTAITEENITNKIKCHMAASKVKIGRKTLRN